MRSMKYVFTGTPECLDDCIDMARKHKVAGGGSVSVVAARVFTVEEATPEWVRNDMYMNFLWQIGDKEVSIDQFYGACLFMESPKRQRVSVDNANLRLEADIGRLAKLGYDVIGKEKRFDYSCTYNRGEQI
ncbi:MAG: hypothetical protein KJ601_07815 [Nanoarchaeota archaeon]|nr:hypothetical protein [Nanoarchaeota archaeon]MBU1704343.1 hypothetical protein [Nanoarchaeota archaeon]